MKKIALVIVAAFFVAQSQAQVRLGLTAGPNYSKQLWKSNSYTMQQSTARFQYHFGLIADIPVAEDWSIMPEFLFSYQGSVLRQETNSSLVNLTKNNIGYVKMPITLQYMIDKENIFWQFNAGVYLSRVGITNHRFLQNDVNVFSGPLEIGNNVTDQLKPFDYGLRAKAGFEIKRGIGMHFFYDYGLQDVSPQLTQSYNRVLGASLSYMFQLSSADKYSRYPDYYNY
ncbi:MAG: hypothetical protein RL660_2053 [Bacteroidota bacterium]|jgi:hypothetical protein